MNTVTITPETFVKGRVAFKEPSGSTASYEFNTTVGKLGISFDNQSVKAPTQEEVQAVFSLPEAERPERLAEMNARFTQSQVMATEDPVNRLRESLIRYFKEGGVPEHPIDSNKYQWVGEANALTVTGKNDAAGNYYIEVTGSAVWGG